MSRHNAEEVKYGLVIYLYIAFAQMILIFASQLSNTMAFLNDDHHAHRNISPKLLYHRQ